MSESVGTPRPVVPNDRRGFRGIKGIPTDTWNRFRILFDQDKRQWEFYINHMSTPLLVERDLDVGPDPGPNAKNSSVSFSDYGFCPPNTVTELRHVKVVALAPGEAPADAQAVKENQPKIQPGSTPADLWRRHGSRRAETAANAITVDEQA